VGKKKAKKHGKLGEKKNDGRWGRARELHKEKKPLVFELGGDGSASAQEKKGLWLKREGYCIWMKKAKDKRGAAKKRWKDNQRA